MSVVAELSLSYFRSHRATKLAVDDRPVAIYGANGAGKTNIIEAVSLLSPGRGLRRAQADELIRRPEALGWKITSILTGNGVPNEIETSAAPGASRSVRIDGKAQPQVALSKIARVVWLVPSMDRLWIEGAEGRRRFLDRITMSFEPSHGEAVLSYEKGMRERNRLLKDMVRDAHWYVALERQMADAGARVTANRRAALARLATASTGAATAFPSPALSITHAEGPLPDDADALAHTLADNRPSDLRAGRTLIGPHRIDLNALFTAKGVAASQCSTGEQKALLISLVLTNARALAEDTGAPPLILLDEVAAHLDTDRRAALYDEIAALGAQAWMTGTGAELFEALGDRAQYIDVFEENGESRAIQKEPS